MQEINSREFMNRILVLERQVGALSKIQELQSSVVQDIVEEKKDKTVYGQQNYIRNGDLSFTRNTYLYTSDYSGGTGEDQNVSEEAAFIYAFPVPNDVETTGSIAGGNNILTINSPLFVPSDVLKFITIYGAGSGGTDLTATIITYNSPTQVAISLNALTGVTNARVRFRLSVFQEDTTDQNADANLATNTALKTSNHTRYSTTVNNPDFDKVNGHIRYSDANYLLGFPLPQNVIMPGRQYILSFLYKLANDVNNNSEVFCKIYAGIWDNTFGRNQFLEGNLVNITGTIEGTPGVTTRTYNILLTLTDGRVIRSQPLTLTNTPNTLNNSNYVKLTWPQESSVVSSVIYRTTGGTIEQIGYPFPANVFYDTGGSIQVVGSIPSSDSDRFTAKVILNESNFAPASSKEWRLATVNILIPSNYNKGLTTDKQWLVIGLVDSLSGTGSTRALLLDKISLDDKYGFFTICPLDFNAKRNTSTTATTGNQGGIGIPIPPGEGGCVHLDDKILTSNGEIAARDLIGNEHKYKILNRNLREVKFEAIVTAKQNIVSIFTEKGYTITGSESHPVITSPTDSVGTKLIDLKTGDSVFTKDGESKIVNIIHHNYKTYTVKFVIKSKDHCFWQNGILVHNRKNEF